MGDLEAKGSGKALNHAEVPKYKMWNPKGCQIQVRQKQVTKSARARCVVPEREKQGLMRQQRIEGELGGFLNDFLECPIHQGSKFASVDQPGHSHRRPSPLRGPGANQSIPGGGSVSLPLCWPNPSPCTGP